jgi:hypothetical protein
MGNRRGVAAGIVAAGLGMLAAQPLAGSAAVLPHHAAGEAVPQLTVPSATVPSATVPSVTVPPVSTPVATTPPVTTPKVTTPSVTTPPVTTPPATVPKVSVPPVTTPRVSTPVATVPSVTTPPSTTRSATGPVRTTASHVSQPLGATPPRTSAGGDPASAGTDTSPSAQGGGGATGGSGAARGSGAAGGATSGAGGTPSAGETADERRGAGASGARPGSPRARRLAAARENRRLRRVVARLRGCLGTLHAGPRRLLTLRAGLHGRPQSATATARILHISVQREDRLERLAVTALGRQTGASCAGSTSASSVGTQATSALSSSPAESAGSSGASGGSGANAGLSSVHASGSPQSSRGGKVNVSPSGERTEQAATGGSFPSAILTALLGLLLAIAIVVVPKLRRDRALPALVGIAAEPDRPRAETASPAPGSGTRGTSGAQSAMILRALRRRTVTRMDPAIAPMAADAFDRMAGDAERGPDPAEPQEDPPERHGADGEGT